MTTTITTAGRHRRGDRRVRAASAAAALTLPLMGLGAAAPEAIADGGHEPRGRIVYVAFNADFTAIELWHMRADGSAQRPLTASPGYDIAPDYSPDGRRIAFTSGRSGIPTGGEDDAAFSETYVMNADGSHVRRVTVNRELVDLAPSWAPDGRTLVLAKGPSDTLVTDLWTVDLGTGRERRLTRFPGTETLPDWSPDGDRIVFTGDVAEPGGSDIYSIRSDGSGLRRLTDLDTAGPPTYSPDGRWITFGAVVGENFDVFVVRANGSGLRNLTRDPGYDDYPTFSADGRSILFVSERGGGGQNDIFSMRLDGTRVTNLTRTPEVNEFEPDAQPAGR